MRKLGAFVVVGLMLSAAAPAFAVNVLLLGDNGSESVVTTALQNAGDQVTSGGVYDAWDGVTPNVNDFDVVVLLDGIHWGYSLQPAALSALQAFVASGHGLVVTEWCAYDVWYPYKTAGFGALMPTESPDGAYGYGDTWTVVDSGSPLVAGVPPSWTESSAGWTHVIAKSGTTVVIEGTGGNPLLSYSNANGGTVVHLNHSMTYNNDPVSANVRQLLVNAVAFAATTHPMPTVTAIPTLGEFGLLAAILLLLGASLVVLRWRRREA